MKKISVCFMLIFVSSILHAQTVRIEIEAKSTFDQYNIIPLKEKGVLVFYETNNNAENSKSEKWIFTLFDTAFNEKWNIEYPMINNVNYSRYSQDEESIYALFIAAKEYEIVKINIETGRIQLMKGNLKNSNYQIKDFKVIDNNVFIGGSTTPENSKVFIRSMLAYIIFPLAFIPNFIPGREALLIHSQLEAKTTREISFNYRGISEVSSITLDTFNQKVNALIENNSNVYVQELKYNGIRNKAIFVKPFTKQYELLNGRLNIINNKERIILGTFSKKNSKGAQGFYFSKFQDPKQDFIQYHSFTKMKNFFEYLDQRNKEKIKKKISNRQKKGKDLTLNYQLVMHNPIIDSNQYLLTAEAYKAQYHTEFRTVWVYGRPVEQSYEVFDGWHYSHAVIVCFDNQGKVIWDNWMPIANILSFNLNEKVKVIKAHNRITLVYNTRGSAFYKIIEGDSVTQKALKANASHEGNDAESEEFNNDINFWYGNYFLSSGIKESKNKDYEYVKGNKVIFYINKIVLD